MDMRCGHAAEQVGLSNCGLEFLLGGSGVWSRCKSDRCERRAINGAQTLTHMVPCHGSSTGQSPFRSRGRPEGLCMMATAQNRQRKQVIVIALNVDYSACVPYLLSGVAR